MVQQGSLQVTGLWFLLPLLAITYQSVLACKNQRAPLDWGLRRHTGKRQRYHATLTLLEHRADRANQMHAKMVYHDRWWNLTYDTLRQPRFWMLRIQCQYRSFSWPPTRNYLNRRRHDWVLLVTQCSTNEIPREGFLGQRWVSNLLPEVLWYLQPQMRNEIYSHRHMYSDPSPR